MTTDRIRLLNDVQTMVSTICPDVDTTKLALRMEEILSNYNTSWRTHEQLSNDIPEKATLFLSSMKIEGLSEITLEDYESELRLFAVHCSKAVSQITTFDIRNYLASLDGIMASTVGKKLSVLKSFFGWLVREEVLLRDPTKKVKIPKKPKRLPRSLSVEELEIVRESCATLRERALVEVMYSTGCRLSEIANLKISDINMQSMSTRVVGKGDVERHVYLSYKSLYHLRKYLDKRADDCEYLFVSVRKPIRQLSNASIQREIRIIEGRADISKKITPHVLRHTFAQLSTDAGIDLSDLQQLLGHSNPATTLTYAMVSEERKQQAHKRYHVQ
ncbi:tyrosine-type recombinase/integrase [Sporosarcina sp. E16_3]|uniref:site-specific tyrosine recombinase/integron integrase n=1 Tax=Sporosarcina sp. E16_3 TaxID=2789293 RepID=UPI001A916B79|nr:site-specific tyrosine recombinase/integron integrase [Sporosarcina sp. E16_3]MBO0602771.1 tyrosine-type recombinase/integrase [Sporosarcina sp. E16_3]